MKKNLFKRVLGFLLAIMIVVPMTLSVDAATSPNTGGLTIKCYPYTNQNFAVYNSTASSRVKIGTCYGASDHITIHSVGSNGWSKITYPAGSGTKTGYCETSYLFQNVNFSGSTGRAQEKITTYTKSSCNAAYGSVSKNDIVYILGSAEGNTQLLYPCSGYYKAGWIKGNYKIVNGVLTNGSNSVGSSASLNANQIKTLTFNAKYYANTNSDLKAAFGYNEAQLYNHWINFGIREGRSASPILHISYYLNNNSDLINAFGRGNYTAAYNHFITFGYKEGRLSSEYYCGNYYRNRHSDLQHFNFYDLACHYLNFGINERRLASPSGKIPNMSGTIVNDTNSLSYDSLIGKTVANINSKYYTSDNISYRAGYEGQCTWYAYGRFYEVVGIKLKTARHAKYWLSDNCGDSRVNVTYGATTIRPKSIAVRTSGSCGHVLFIENVTYHNGSPKYVYFTECNADGNGKYNLGVDCIVKKLSYANFVETKKPAGYISAK